MSPRSLLDPMITAIFAPTERSEWLGSDRFYIRGPSVKFADSFIAAFDTDFDD
jgi:hypothetical protein